MTGSILLTLLLTANGVQAQQGSFEAKLRQISESSREAVRANDIPALSIGIHWQGRIHFINHGTYRRDSPDKVSQTSIYQLASLSKTFVGIVANQLIRDGKLKLNDSICTHLTSLSESAKSKLQPIKIQHLLGHTSGLPRTSASRKVGRIGVNLKYGTKELMQELERIELEFQPGSEFRYSNFGFALLAHVCENASGKPYPALVRKLVTEPHKMDDTAFVIDQVQSKRLVTPYNNINRKQPGAPWVMGKLGPPSALYSTVADLTALMQAQIRAYREHENASKSSRLVLNTKRSTKTTGLSYGFGFFDWGDGTFGHGGGMDGYGSQYHICPKADFGFVFLTSSCGAWQEILSQRISSILQGKSAKDWTPFDPAEQITQMFQVQGVEAAMQLYTQFRSAKPSPLNLGSRLRLAESANTIGKPELATMVLQHAAIDFPNSKEVKSALKALNHKRRP